MKRGGKLLFTAMSVVFATLGATAIVTEVHSASTKRHGIVTVFGDDAIWVGQTLLWVALMPLAVWLPARWLGKALVLWWLVLMGWLFVPLFLR